MFAMMSSLDHAQAQNTLANVINTLCQKLLSAGTSLGQLLRPVRVEQMICYPSKRIFHLLCTTKDQHNIPRELYHATNASLKKPCGSKDWAGTGKGR